MTPLPPDRHPPVPVALFRLRVLLALVGCSLLWAASPAFAQEATPRPSAPQELWDAYPLTASPTPTPATTAAAASSPATEQRKVRAPTTPAVGDGSAVPPVLAGLVLALGAIALLWTFRPGRRRPAAPAVVDATASDSGSSSGAAPIGVARDGSRQDPLSPPAARAQSPRPRRAETLLLSAADPPPAGNGHGGHDAHPPLDLTAPVGQGEPAPIAPRAPASAAPHRPPAAPPDPRRAWSAEVTWAFSGSEPRFAAVARSEQHEDPSVIAESPPLQWPPAGPAAVQALTEAVAELERALLAAGWTALEPGSAWYARRFGWKPKTHVAAAPVSSPAGARTL